MAVTSNHQRRETWRQFLIDAVALLSSSLDYDATLITLANLTVPEIADWCSIAMRHDDGSIHTLAVAHVDPAKVALAHDLQKRIPAASDDVRGVAQVIRSGTPDLTHEITDSMLVEAISDPEVLATMRQLGFCSAMIVPLKARGQTLGAITLVSAESAHLFDEDDLSLAQDLASRAALAIDNARLYQQAQKVAAEHTAVMERIADALVLVSSNEEITFMNEAARRFFGAQLVGQSVEQSGTQIQVRSWKDGAYDPDLFPSRRALRGEVVHDLEWKVLLPDGTDAYLLGSASPVDTEDGNRLGAVVAFRDVTSRKQAEDELHRLSAELEQRVIERTVQLESANQELEAFAYSVSHDLRAPLRSMDGFSQVLLERFGEQFDERGTRYLNHIRDAAQEMGRLIDALLQLSRVSRGEMRPERVDLSGLAHSIEANLHTADPDREVQFVIDHGMAAIGDAPLLHVALENLIGNAWKYTRNSPCARIELSVTRQDAIPVFMVRDNGAGFDMAYVDKLFTPFQRLHAAGEFEGTGIGLATVQRIIHRHGGRIWAESATGQGATFCFTLQPTRKSSA